MLMCSHPHTYNMIIKVIHNLYTYLAIYVIGLTAKIFGNPFSKGALGVASATYDFGLNVSSNPMESNC